MSNNKSIVELLKTPMDSIGPQYKKTHDKVIILGTASTLTNVNWALPDFDYWACSPVITQPSAQPHLKKISVMFEMHPMEYWIKIIDRLNNTDIPCYMHQRNPHVKKSMTYPLRQIQAMVLNSKLQKYFTSTISYMIAMAIYLKYKRVEMWGVHMSAEEEYGDQRQACESWLAFADGRGIETYIPEQSEIFKCPYLYGYEQEHNIVIQARHRNQGLTNGLKKLEADLERLKIDINMQKGAIRNNDHWIRTYK